MSGGKRLKLMTRSKIMSEPNFLQNITIYILPFNEIKDGFIFGYDQCGLVAQDELKTKIANFPTKFKKKLKWKK